MGTAILSILSCSAHKQTVVSLPTSGYDSQTIARLSRQFGVQLTKADNISLYYACNGWLGVKYRYGGNTKKGVDCSGLVNNLYRQVFNIKLERNSANILRKNCVTINRNSVREGDLVFFNTTGPHQTSIPSHVGLYLKNGKFIHASSSSGVIISNLSENYYVSRWISGGRVKK